MNKQAKKPTWKHVALIGTFHGHVLIHPLYVELLIHSELDFRVGNYVLDIAVDNIVLDVKIYIADDFGDAKASQKALVPATSMCILYSAVLCMMIMGCTHHTYHDLTPVMTNFPLVNRSAVHLGLSMRIVMAAKRFRSYVLHGRSIPSWERLMGISLPLTTDVDTMLWTMVSLSSACSLYGSDQVTRQSNTLPNSHTHTFCQSLTSPPRQGGSMPSMISASLSFLLSKHVAYPPLIQWVLVLWLYCSSNRAKQQSHIAMEWLCCVAASPLTYPSHDSGWNSKG